MLYNFFTSFFLFRYVFLISFFIFSYVTFLFNGSDFYFMYFLFLLFLSFFFFLRFQPLDLKNNFYFCLFLLFFFFFGKWDRNYFNLCVCKIVLIEKKRNTSTQKSIITTAHSCHFVLCLVVSRVKGRRY